MRWSGVTMDLERERRIYQLLQRVLATRPDLRASVIAEFPDLNAEERARLFELTQAAAEEEARDGQTAAAAPAEPGDAQRDGAAPSIDVGTEGAADPDFASAVLRRLAAREGSFGRYSLKGEVARGGQGVVLRVWDEDLRRNLAMKVMLGRGEPAETGKTPPADPRSLGRFLEEAQVTGQLDHPGIVPVHELGLDSQGRVFFTMKLVKGEDLKAVFARVHAGEAEWSQTRALSILLRVCEAMSYAHSKRVIHRDLKPSNIMVGRYGEVFVMDWGLARMLDRKDDKDVRVRPQADSFTSGVNSERRERAASEPDSPLLTMDGDIVGTPAYMSPEQASGHLERMGPASDVYALGAMLYHLLTGRMPYVTPDARVNNYAILSRVQEGPPVGVASLAPKAPVELVAICEKAMARDPGDRYTDMSALADDLRASLENRVVRAYRTGAAAELGKWVRRNRLVATGTVVLLLLAVAVLVFVDDAREQRRVATEATAKVEVEHLARNLADMEAAHSLATEADAHMRAAKLAAERGNWNALIQELDLMTAVDSADPRIHVMKARAFIGLSRVSDASAELKESELTDVQGDVKGERLLLQGYLGMLGWDAKGAPPGLLQKAIDAGLSPADEAFAYALLAGTAERAKVLLTAALKAEPFHFLAWDALIQTEFWQGNVSTSMQTAERMAFIFPEDPAPEITCYGLAAMVGDVDRQEVSLSVLRPMIDAESIAELQKFDGALKKAIECYDPEELAFSYLDSTLFAIRTYSALSYAGLAHPLAIQQLAQPRAPILPFIEKCSGSLSAWLIALSTHCTKVALGIIAHEEFYNPSPSLSFLRAVTLMQDLDFRDKEAVELVLSSLSEAARGELLIPAWRPVAVYMKARLQYQLYLLCNDDASRSAARNALHGLLDDRDTPPLLLAATVQLAADIGDWDLSRTLWHRWREVTPQDADSDLEAVELAMQAGALMPAIEIADRFLRELPVNVEVNRGTGPGADDVVATKMREFRTRALADLGELVDAMRAGPR
jgi:serine/threonine protein kinase